MTAEDEPTAGGSSLLPGAERFQRDPGGAVRALAHIASADALFADGGLPSFEGCPKSPWCSLRIEALQRARARLLHRYLQTSTEAGMGLGEPPAVFDQRGLFDDPTFALMPKERFDPIDELRLRVRYDSGLEEYRKSGTLGWSPATWAPMCRGEVTAKKPSLGALCERLGATSH